jgi:hypothetical protein
MRSASGIFTARHGSVIPACSGSALIMQQSVTIVYLAIMEILMRMP